MTRMTDTIKPLGEALDAFDGELARQTASPSTRRHYRAHLNHLADDAQRVGKRFATG